jgi:hypothetical protein
LQRTTAGVFDRVLLGRGIRRAFERTFVALGQELIGMRYGWDECVDEVADE